MRLTLELTPNEEAQLRAVANGKTLEETLHSLIKQILEQPGEQSPPFHYSAELSDDADWEADMLALSEGWENLPVLPAAAFSRESIWGAGLMRILVDANILLRLIQPSDPLYAIAFSALRTLRRQGEQLVIVPQTLFEFWNVCTRPGSARGGFGLATFDTDARMRRLERRYLLLPDNLAVFQEWRRLVVAHSVAGVQVHDARLAAAMYVHGITHILTFNGGDFARYAGVIIIDPKNV